MRDYGEDPPIPSIKLGDRWHIARRRAGVCSACRRTIALGERYRVRFGLIDGQAAWDKTCTDCQIYVH